MTGPEWQQRRKDKWEWIPEEGGNEAIVTNRVDFFGNLHGSWEGLSTMAWWESRGGEGQQKLKKELKGFGRQGIGLELNRAQINKAQKLMN